MVDIIQISESGGHIVDEPLSEALSQRYLAYALSTIMNRALPDVRDGLKPVHRRLLYAMRVLRLHPHTSAKKCARVVGDVIGKYHPHGDTAVYEALVRLAQDFSQRYPLIDGQGNFGNIDGDNAAAMRYTECRLTTTADLLLEGIDEDAVDFRPTYDGEEEEPLVLPASFPNLLANGAAGIAVGMATSIPPHNAGELIDACLLLIKNPQAETRDLLQFVRGPDFPTGGIIIEPRANLQEAYETGRGGIRLRSHYEVERLDRGLWRIIVTEIPYQVQKSRLVEQLADLIENKKAPFLGDVRDESSEDIRLVLEPKSRNITPEHLMESLFALCDLETRFPMNMNVLDRSATPRVMGLKSILQAFLAHRQEVNKRRALWRLEKIDHRLHVLEGLLLVFLNLDEVIRIVRFSEDPKAELIAAFTLSEIQAEAILNTRLRQLAKLEETTLRQEHDSLAKEKADLVNLLHDEKLQWKKIAQDLAEVRRKISLGHLGERRSRFAEAPTLQALEVAESLVSRELITIIISQRGWIRTAKGHLEDTTDLKFKDGDSLAYSLPAETTDKLLLLTSDGRFFTLACDKLPSARGHGEPLRLMLEVEDHVRFIAAFPYRSGAHRLLASDKGYGFLIKEEDALSGRKAGKQVLNLEAGASALFCLEANGDYLALSGDNGKILIFPLSDIPFMAKGKGVKLQSYREGGLKEGCIFSTEETPKFKDGKGRKRDLKDWKDWQGRRAGAGKPAPKWR